MVIFIIIFPEHVFSVQRYRPAVQVGDAERGFQLVYLEFRKAPYIGTVKMRVKFSTAPGIGDFTGKGGALD